MTRFLVATDSVHTTAAACDYLGPRLDAGDSVRVVGVTEDGSRDAGDAVNVASARLTTPTVETAVRDGEAVDEIREELERGGVDELVVGAHEPGPGAESGLGRTARALVGRVEVPCVVLPPVGLE
ncbi:universal stress protein [Halarchaeum nitratireducens]|uniref:UspA domain-containing protein n=1 Tax=Halarchaeum nitratireducens TaxID=489913 RepID=A0A830GE53_9EURY|nr:MULTISPECIES: universal stress protein [Halarchaeum]MBP2251730.1 nucleotide-binding universal stress UspA family protein [Halarchaeum solikamskense]GGN22683.1 hypothetical protein GCM10009021_25310 [Halarchaeum nitratireducens]